MDIHKLRAATPPTNPTKPDTSTRGPQGFAPSTRAYAPARTSPVRSGPNAADWCFAQHTKRHGLPPAPGEGHNIWLAALTKFCNESGAEQNDVLALALSTAPAGHDEAKITATVAGIYRRDSAAHGSRPYTAPEPTGNKTYFPASFRQKENPPPPTFAAAVYDALPNFLQRACYPFEGHEKAVMLLGTLAVLSGCFPAVGGTYNKRRFGLNLFTFIIAPAASGKGTLAWARRLAWPHHKALTDASRAARLDYEAELAAYKTAGKAKASLTPPPAAPPPYKLLYLPGNTTAAALQTALAENDGRGIMCETEADTLTGALGADFGNFSDVLRKAFQHEPISLLRKTDRQHLDLARPALSIALTGTPGQLPRLMPSAEDGLVSRFLFYVFEQTPTWQDVSPSAGPPLDPYFDRLAEELTRMIAAVPEADEAGTYPVEITLAAPDWQRLNTAGAAGLDEALALAGGAGGSSAYRLGLVAWRIAGLLTLLRCFENGQAPTGRLEADPADVGTALAIMDTARAHALAVLAMLPTPGGTPSRYAAKAEQETRAQELHAQGLGVREIARQVGVHFTTVARWLRSEDG
ncbi:DUF3987 domain-containing protein [Hymenobacter sp. BT491]|uniref:DUF3987 domain-containing protein n=1 Tax=Hymenobacter sp. BT491 TaxID=2766779 RepID=UPI0016536006|nr:DUF3987 domain-containing protein [Hymenobacter sp. BT491]MBC6991944.1 DUF3987 domain-containing protein [Hymenobacter sp. BT491]